MVKQVIPTICQTGCILGLDRGQLYSASDAAATVFDPKRFPIAYERLRKKLYYFSTSRPVDKDELPSNPDNAFRDAHGKPVLVLNAKNQWCVALLPGEIYPRWLGSTWQRYVTEEEKAEYEQAYQQLRQGFLAVLVSFILQVFAGVFHMIQTRQKSFIHAREELQRARQLVASKESQPSFYGWREKIILPALMCLLGFGFFGSHLFQKEVQNEVGNNSKEESSLALIENRMTKFKKQRGYVVDVREICPEKPPVQFFASLSLASNTGISRPQNLTDTPP